jgi:hypothetical protein
VFSFSWKYVIIECVEIPRELAVVFIIESLG